MPPLHPQGGANPKQPPTSLRPKPLPNLHPQGWCQPQSNAWRAAQRPQKRPLQHGRLCFPISPILPPGIAHTETRVWRIRAAACRPCTARVVPIQSNRQPLSALNPSQTCTRKGGANPKATRGILPHKPPIRLKKSVKQALVRIAIPQANTVPTFGKSASSLKPTPPAPP